MYLEMSDKIKLYVKQVGKGKPCIFIHGGPGAWSYNFEVFCGSDLERTMEMIYFDQRGCGRSSGDESSDYSIDRIVEDIEEIRKQLGISKLNILAHSFGGIIAVNYAYKYQHHVEGLILSNCTLHMEDSLRNQAIYGTSLLSLDKFEVDENKFIMEQWQEVITKIFEKNLFYKFQYKEYDNFLKVNEVDEAIENRSLANQAFSNKEYFLNHCDLTKDITVPVLIITGNEDFAIGCEHYKKFRFPNKVIEIIPGRHVLYLENQDQFILVIKNFIENYL